MGRERSLSTFQSRICPPQIPELKGQTCFSSPVRGCPKALTRTGNDPTLWSQAGTPLRGGTENAMADLDIVSRTLETHAQTHLLRFYKDLPPERRSVLLEQLAGIDFEHIDQLIRKYVRTYRPPTPEGDIRPTEILPVNPSDKATQKLYTQARKKAHKLIAEGKVAAFVVAGGQGTRLGYEGPKGCLEATPVAHKPLFQVFAEQILSANARYGVTIPWYVMTSSLNDVATKAYFRQHNFFGLDEGDVFFLVQGSMPVIGLDGKLLLSDKDTVATSPNGHGGSFLGLRESGALADMARRGIELISYFQVDNPLVRCIDPLFLGLHDLHNADMSAKVLPKRSPTEKLGNVCLLNGRLTVIEYSDMPEDLATECTEDGHLRFSAGSIAIHIISRQLVEKLTVGGKCDLPFHRAEKIVPYINETGQLVQPEKPNAVKLEMFVFDALPLADKAVVLETDRSEEFSPIKNNEGADSLATSLHDQIRRAAGWLETAGLTIPRDAEGQVAAAIEISPLYADSPEALTEKIDQELKISPGQSVYLGSRGQTGGLR